MRGKSSCEPSRIPISDDAHEWNKRRVTIQTDDKIDRIDGVGFVMFLSKTAPLHFKRMICHLTNDQYINFLTTSSPCMKRIGTSSASDSIVSVPLFISSTSRIPANATEIANNPAAINLIHRGRLPRRGIRTTTHSGSSAVVGC